MTKVNNYLADSFHGSANVDLTCIIELRTNCCVWGIRAPGSLAPMASIFSGEIETLQDV